MSRRLATRRYPKAFRTAWPIVFAEEKTRPDQPEPNTRLDESENAGEFRHISLAALVRMKLAAFRDKDRVHLRDLVSVSLVDESSLPSLSPAPRERLAIPLKGLLPTECVKID